jgi:hypothetical protein
VGLGAGPLLTLLPLSTPLIAVSEANANAPLPTVPCAEEIAEARKNPGGWIYRIAGRFRPDEAVPGAAIVGAWKVDDSGNIVGGFVLNPHYDMERHPPFASRD